MPELVSVRVACFIPQEWLVVPSDDETIEYRGDGRDFTGEAVATGRSRVEQVAAVDFRYEDVTAHARAGRSVERIVDADGNETLRLGRADTSAIRCHDVEWKDGVRFRLTGEAANPLREDPLPVNYALTVRVEADGTVAVAGSHDGFPNVEIHAREDFGRWESLYEHDYRDAGESPLSLAGPMDYEIDVSR